MSYFDRIRALKDGTSAGADKAWETRRGGSNAPPEKSDYAKNFYKAKHAQMMQSFTSNPELVAAVNPGGKAYADDMRRSIEEDAAWERMAAASATGGKATMAGVKRQMKKEQPFDGLFPKLTKR
jgi:hypothetical protein